MLRRFGRLQPCKYTIRKSAAQAGGAENICKERKLVSYCKADFPAGAGASPPMKGVLMKRFLHKTVSCLLTALFCAVLLAAFSPAETAKAAGYDDVTAIVENYWGIVTSGGSQHAYWNKHYFADALIRQTEQGDYLSQITRSPCSVTPGAEHLYVNGCTSNNWYGYSQCWGFTLYMGYISTGAVNEGGDYGTRYYNVASDFHFLPGDHIRYGWRENGDTATHSLFIYKVAGGVVYTIECNWGANCRINLRSFSEADCRWFVNRFNGGDNSDFLFRPYSVNPKDVTGARAVRVFRNSVWSLAGGFKHGEGQNAEKNALYLEPFYFEAKTGDTVILEREDAVNETPNGFYLSDQISTNAVSGSWGWYDLPLSVTQKSGEMQFSYWYYPYTYSISYELDGGENDPENPESYTVLYGVRLKKPEKEGYLFAGWMLDGKRVRGINEGCNASFASSDELYAALSERMTGDVTLTAAWIRPYPGRGIYHWKSLERPPYMK